MREKRRKKNNYRVGVNIRENIFHIGLLLCIFPSVQYSTESLTVQTSIGNWGWKISFLKKWLQFSCHFYFIFYWNPDIFFVRILWLQCSVFCLDLILFLLSRQGTRIFRQVCVFREFISYFFVGKKCVIDGKLWRNDIESVMLSILCWIMITM